MFFRGLKTFVFLAFCAALALSGARASAQARDQGPGTDFFAEVSSISPERPFWIAVPVVPMKGAYIPWIDGETGGRGVVLDFALPEGFAKGEVIIAPPKPLFGGEIYGYDEYFWILQEITPAPDAVRRDVYTIPGYVAWRECAGIECLDFEEELALSLPLGPGLPDPENAELFAEVRGEMPAFLPWPVRYQAEGGSFLLEIMTGRERAAAIASLLVLPDWGASPGGINHSLALEKTDNGVSIGGKVKDFMPAARLSGFLYVGSASGYKVYRFDATNLADTDAAAAPGTPARAGLTIWMAVALALAGGMILNLMPCVFPVLTLKIFGLVKAGSQSRRHLRGDGLAYTAGILTTFVFVALLLLTFRQMGYEVGWGFQLQSPYFVTVLALILFLVTLNFAGLFEIRLPFAVSARPDAGGALASFYTGMLATVVATPCTAPFMAPALAFALTLPTIDALAVFLALGAGLALPYLAVCFIPGAARLFPKPGRWMVVLRKILAVPLLATVAWLVYVLHSQVDAGGVYAVLSYMALIVATLVAFRATRDWSRAMRTTLMATLTVIAFATLVNTRPAFETIKERPRIEAGDVEEWSDEAVWNYRLQGRGVFVNFTATWCLTCIVNEKRVFRRDKFQQFLADNDIVYMEADWTNEDPGIARALEELGRSALPVYVFYPPGGPTVEPVLLPEILSLDAALRILSGNIP